MDGKRIDSERSVFMLRLSKRIKEEREKRGWDVIEVVIRSGVSQSTIYNLESNLADNVGIKSLVGLSVAFEIDLITLIQERQ